MPNKRSKLAVLLTGAALLGWIARRRSKEAKRMDFTGKVVVITGGSRGLGLLMARRLASKGARLALLARRENELERAVQELSDRGVEVLALTCDVGNQNQMERAMAQVLERWGRIDILVNNAGIIQVGPMEHMNLSDYEEAMQVHFWGPLYAMLATIPTMRQQGEGRIVNITSVGGEIAIPHLAPYIASKYALVGLSDSFRAELAKDKIAVTTVIPGLMRTGSHVNGLFKGNHRSEYAWFSILGANPLASTAGERAADQIIEALRFADPRLTITPQARLLVLSNHIFPGLTAAITKLANRLLPKYNPTEGYIARGGLESQSRWSPSWLTVLSDLAAERNNELICPDRLKK